MNRSPTTRRSALRALAAMPALALLTAGLPALAAAPLRAVFQATEADPKKWQMVFNNLRNARAELPDAVLELVVFGPAIEMLRTQSDMAPRLREAIAAGVRVQACRNSMQGFGVAEADLVPGTTIVPSGVAHVIRRQAEGYAYVRP
ncbi:hypothetical protein IP92_02134 [Pseudoduganella flava]|uniref:Uncharacterized protein n=1 Tax=Pseudoduganella flava TaxID=871742 RepID=A0A562PWB1_9BURK|nr:DsrE family protein [Pseudoduganella flava]QGZ39820.1 hypothetical protein GO485_12670 [Pseudoduganella flava]TWI48741.1 hypothetical protein IP92_02134 [Pseudoduganella flava]